MWKVGVGILILVFGFFIGNYLAKWAKEELPKGQSWFKLIIVCCLSLTVLSLLFRSDVLFFTSLFIVVVTSRSLKN